MSSTKNPGRFAGLLYLLTSIIGFFAMGYVPSCEERAWQLAEKLPIAPSTFLVGPHLGYAKLQNRRAFWDIAGARVA